MKTFLFIALFMIIGLTGVQAQEALQNTPVKTAVIAAEAISTIETDSKEVAAKKKDILVNKIASKLRGEINIFVLKETRLVC
ncbi:hypothetical protein ACW5R3_10500 [Bizionia sp. KMM 8389]